MMNKGILFIIISSLFFSIINGLVKYFDRIPAIEIVFFRSIVSLILSYASLYNTNTKIFNKNSPLLIARGLSGALALSLYFYTIQKIPLASAVTILYLAPIFTVLLSIFLLKESPSAMQIPFFIVSFIGASFLKQFDARVDVTYFAMGITAAFFAGLAYNFIRMLRGKVHHQLIILYFPLMTIPIVSPYVYQHWVTPTVSEFIGMILIGIITQLAQVFMTKAYLFEKASKISHFSYLTSVFAYFTGLIFFNENLTLMGGVGLILIIFGVILSSYFSPKEKDTHSPLVKS